MAEALSCDVLLSVLVITGAPRQCITFPKEQVKREKDKERKEAKKKKNWRIPERELEEKSIIYIYTRVNGAPERIANRPPA